jgi:hypothetical protein
MERDVRGAVSGGVMRKRKDREARAEAVSTIKITIRYSSTRYRYLIIQIHTQRLFKFHPSDDRYNSPAYFKH